MWAMLRRRQAGVREKADRTHQPRPPHTARVGMTARKAKLSSFDFINLSSDDRARPVSTLAFCTWMRMVRMKSPKMALRRGEDISDS